MYKITTIQTKSKIIRLTFLRKEIVRSSNMHNVSKYSYVSYLRTYTNTHSVAKFNKSKHSHRKLNEDYKSLQNHVFKSIQ